MARPFFPLFLLLKSLAFTAGQLRAHLINSDGGPQLGLPADRVVGEVFCSGKEMCLPRDSA